MPNIAGNKMLKHLDRITGKHLPITADIFLTNYCNNNCPYCTYKRWELDEGARAMPYDEFVRYAERLRSLGVLGFILTGGGEPTLAPDFDKITTWLESCGIHYGMNTNFNNLVLCKPDYLKVSLDGYDEASYEKNRGVRKYEVARQNIKAYYEWKCKNSPRTTLGIQKMVESVAEAFAFYEANKDLPVDYIVFRPRESTAGAYYNDPCKLDEAETIVSAVKTMNRFDKRVCLNFKWGMLGQHEESCTAQWAQIAVNERGQVMYCCHKPYEIVGHVLDADILEKKAAFKTNMAMCDIPCRMTAPNALVASIENGMKDTCFI
nr:MAG TPA: tungsten cofactor oxidoreductase radical SAM maturase [Caudoviricetes sp.]